MSRINGKDSEGKLAGHGAWEFSQEVKEKRSDLTIDTCAPAFAENSSLVSDFE